MILETEALGFFETLMNEANPRYPVKFYSDLLLEHQQIVAKILQRELFLETNPRYPVRTIEQEEARVAQQIKLREGKTEKQILTDILKKFGLEEDEEKIGSEE